MSRRNWCTVERFRGNVRRRQRRGNEHNGDGGTSIASCDLAEENKKREREKRIGRKRRRTSRRRTTRIRREKVISRGEQEVDRRQREEVSF